MIICCSQAGDLSTDASFEFELHESIDGVRESDWYKLVPENNPLLDRSYLRLLEEVRTNGMEFIYALVRKDGGVVGICYFQVVRFMGKNLVPYFPEANSLGKRLIFPFAKKLINAIDTRLLVSGNLFITGEKGAYFVSHFGEKERTELLLRTIQAIKKKRKDISSVLLPDMYDNGSNYDQAFIQQCYKRIFVEADMEMELPQQWQVFDDYLNAISSKYRVRANKIINGSSALERRDMTYHEIIAHEAELFDLYNGVASKAAFNIARLPAAYFSLQKKLMPERYQLFGYFLDGKMVGFMSLFRLSHHSEVHYCGIDYSLNKDYNIYQRMLYDIVRFAIENHIRRLHFGRTAPEMKSNIGAIPAPMYGYLKHRNPLVNMVMGLFTSRLKPREYVLRSPFSKKQ
ncbi:MAG: GNAT family N-acetyltransferase [Chitinophagales bacterium]